MENMNGLRKLQSQNLNKELSRDCKIKDRESVNIAIMAMLDQPNRSTYRRVYVDRV